MILFSYAKLNLYLEVLNRRKDGYHNLKTLFERIDLSDKIVLKNLPHRSIKIISQSKQIPKDETNLAYRAARLLQDAFNLNQGVEIKIFKRIPVGSGMGGGSSNAASVLLGLNKLWKLRVRRPELIKLAGKLGSDVPFFIYELPFALGQARGERIKVLNSLHGLKFWHILIVPRLSVSTPRIYKEWDNRVLRQKAALTRPQDNVNILVSSLKKRHFSNIKKGLFNSLEEVTTAFYPELIKIKERLKSLTLDCVLMSGSGPAVFAICRSRKEARAAYAQLKKNRFWQVFLAKTH